MNNGPLMGNGTQLVAKSERIPHVREIIPQKIIGTLLAFKEASIGSIVLFTMHYCDNLVVIHESFDSTPAVARNAGAKVIVHEVNEGKRAALKIGFTAASDIGEDIMVKMDLDSQHNPSDIPRLVTPIRNSTVDMVNGSRYLNYMDKNTTIYHRVGQTILNTATNINFSLRITDSQSGFRAFATSIKNVFRFNGFNAQIMAIESETLADAGGSELRIKEVEIGDRCGVDCPTISPVKHGLGILLTILKDVVFKKPLFCLTFPRFIVGISGLAMGAKFLEEFSIGRGMIFRPTIAYSFACCCRKFYGFDSALLRSISSILNEVRSA